VHGDILLDQMEELRRLFPELALAHTSHGDRIVKGRLGFTVDVNGEQIQDDYHIELIIPSDYPLSPPKARETSNKLPIDKDWHINSDGTMCLGAPLAVKMTFAQEPTLLWFVREQVVRFLSWMSYKREHGRMPYQELPHFSAGLVRYYRDLFATSEDDVVLRLLLTLATGKSRGARCPCRSGRRFDECHGALCQELSSFQAPDAFLLDHAEILHFLHNRRKNFRIGQHMLPYVLLPANSRIECDARMIFTSLLSSSARVLSPWPMGIPSPSFPCRYNNPRESPRPFFSRPRTRRHYRELTTSLWADLADRLRFLHSAGGG